MTAEKESRIAQLAALLDRALAGEGTIEPITLTDPQMSVDDAYAVQMINVSRALERGAAITGKKIGLTSLAMQQMLGVNEPDYGHLFDTMNVTGKSAPIDRLIQPKVEGEIAFVLKEDLRGPGVTVEDVLRAAGSVVGAIEIVDSRVRDWKIKLVDTVADNASSALYVLGSVELDPGALSLTGETMQLYRNGEPVSRGAGADVMGDPARCVAWLANALSAYGTALKKGEVVLSGALSAAVPAARGDRFEAVFSRLGRVAVTFE